MSLWDKICRNAIFIIAVIMTAFAVTVILIHFNVQNDSKNSAINDSQSNPHISKIVNNSATSNNDNRIVVEVEIERGA